MNKREIFDQLIIRAISNVQYNTGGPFSSVIFKNGKALDWSCNHVTLINDPTDHAEICNIRETCRKLKTWDLTGCTLYASCKPCMMCLGACYWANIKKIYYAASPFEAFAAGFKDKFINEQMTVADRPEIEEEQYRHKDMNKPFVAWLNKQNKKEY